MEQLVSLQDKKIILGISGGIAAYKCAELTRLLIKAGAEVRVVMTEGAQSFITPLTLQALSGNPVSTSVFDESAELSMGHIELGKWADLVLIAPATANVIAAMTAGLGNDLLTTLCLASTAPVAIAPAMNQEMYLKPVTQENIATLTRRGIHIWGPAQGTQACGDVGPGRMLEPAELVAKISEELSPVKELTKVNITITAGPTQEAIDPVRYLSNHSSGKMGYAIAKAAAQKGANVTLISGPCQLSTPNNVQRIDVLSAEDMYSQVHQSVASGCDIFISCAAVADFRASKIWQHKMKKESHTESMMLELVKNPDIVASVAALSENRPYTVGFAAETQDVETYAKGKLTNKKLDLICANDVSDGKAFNSDTNALHLYWQTGEKVLPLTDKRALALALMDEIFTLYKQKDTEK